MANLSILILTYNEELHIARAIQSVANIAREVVLVDSGSTDRTTQIAESLGARVLKHQFTNYSKQFQWGLDNGGLLGDWIMRLDADEIIEPDLASEIETGLNSMPEDITGIYLKRKHIFMGRWIRHGGRFPLLLMRIWRRGLGRIEDRWMDEHIIIDSGHTAIFSGGFSDVNLNDLTFFTEKHNKYATREAIDIIIQKLRLFDQDAGIHHHDGASQASVKRRIKEKIYNRIPFQFSASAYFFYRYFAQLGFLDGVEGAIYHGLQGWWYRFLVGAKVVELEKALAGESDKEIAIALLSSLTGYDF